MQLQLITPLVLGLMIMTACDTATTLTATVTPRPSPTVREIPAQTPAPTFTPVATENLPALELLSGSADTCTIAESYSEVLGFDAMYYEMTTDNHVGVRLIDDEGTVIVDDDNSSENKDGEQRWGFYPLAYDLPENGTLTIEVAVFENDADDAIPTSFSSLTYNCTTGETIDSSFERNP